jgi:hypothetical protein
VVLAPAAFSRVLSSVLAILPPITVEELEGQDDKKIYVRVVGNLQGELDAGAPVASITRPLSSPAWTALRRCRLHHNAAGQLSRHSRGDCPRRVGTAVRVPGIGVRVTPEQLAG